jgi:oligopeptide transport system permease protein
MGTFFLRRFLQILLILWAGLTLLFFMFVAIPGSSLEERNSERSVSETTRKNFDRRYGLDKPVHVQYVRYWKAFVQGDLGESEVNDRKVSTMLGSAAKTSSRLAFWGFLVQLLIGIPSGVYAAVRRYGWFDKISGVLSVFIAGIPVFVSGILFQFFFGVLPGPNYWKWPKWTRLNFSGFDASGGDGSWALHFIPTGATWRSLVLPAITIALVQTGYLSRLTRTSLLEVLRAEYMRTAASKGLSRTRVIFKHGLRNALIPVVTVLGVDLIAFFGVAVLTETVFTLNGIGSTVAKGAQAQDSPLVLGFVGPIVIFAGLLYLLIDVAYAWLDPRIRLQ